MTNNIYDALKEQTQHPLLGENEEKLFDSLQDCLDFTKEQKDSDIWATARINQMRAFPIPRNEVCAPVLLKTAEYDLEYSNTDTLISTMLDTQLGINVPIKELESVTGESYVIPDGYQISAMLRCTADRGNRDRAGINGPVFKKLYCGTVAEILNKCYPEWGSKCLILYRDGKIGAMHSGDKADYSILPVYDSVGVLYKKLCEEYGTANVEFIEGKSFISHEYFVEYFRILNQTPSPLLKEAVEAIGYKTEGMELVVRHSTNDVASCGQNLACYIEFSDGNSIQIGETIVCSHRHKHTVEEHFANNCDLIAASFKDSSERLKELSKVKIKHPIGCFKAVAKALGVARKWVVATNGEDEAALESFRFERSTDCSAFEVYFYLWKIIGLMREKGASNLQIFNMQEMLSRSLKFRWTEYDIDEKDIDY